MNGFGADGNLRSAFLGQKQRRKSEQAPKWSLLGALFEYFEDFFAKSGLFFAKIERNRTVFEHFEKKRVVFALRDEASKFVSKNKDLREVVEFDEAEFAAFPAMFPEGEYEFEGETIDGEKIEGTAELTWDLPFTAELDVEGYPTIEWTPGGRSGDRSLRGGRRDGGR